MMDMYAFVDKTAELYSTLQDDLSRQIFWARLQADVEWCTPKETAMAGLFRLSALCKKRKAAKIILYGTRVTGRIVATHLKGEGIEIFGFCGRGYQKYPDGLMGKPVFSPEWLVTKGRDAYVVIAASDTYGSFGEIQQFLRDHAFPAEHILTEADVLHHRFRTVQYFDFPELFPAGTAFVDAGAFDGSTSIQFAEWCANNYSRIIALEPDPENYRKARERFDEAGLRNLTLLEAGLSDKCSEVEFYSASGVGSHILSGDEKPQQVRQFNMARFVEQNKLKTIHTVRLDDIVGEEAVGFIKMDIEGAEYDALHGAQQTIIRDRPLLAICVYHNSGDLLAIMDCCRQFVPEYRFWLRQYDTYYETVLYASCNNR